VANGDGGDFAHYLRDSAGNWKQITRFEDGIKLVKFGRDGALYLLSRKDAPHGKILRLPLVKPEIASATLVAPERKGVVQEFAPNDDGLYASYLLGGPSELTYFRRGNTRSRDISIQRIPVWPASIHGTAMTSCSGT